MNDPQKIIIVDDQLERNPLKFSALLAMIGSAEHAALARVHDSPPVPRAEDYIGEPQKQIAHTHPRRLGSLRGSGLLEMMLGLGAKQPDPPKFKKVTDAMLGIER